MMKIGLTTALRYTADRPQFGDVLVLDYLTTQRRLLPGLAATYALHVAMGDLKVCVCVWWGCVGGGLGVRGACWGGSRSKLTRP